MSYNDEIEESMKAVPAATILYRERQFEKAWEAALKDPLLLPVASKEQWFEWCARKEFGISHEKFKNQQ